MTARGAHGDPHPSTPFPIPPPHLSMFQHVLKSFDFGANWPCKDFSCHFPKAKACDSFCSSPGESYWSPEMMGEGWVMGYPPRWQCWSCAAPVALSHASYDGTVLWGPAVGPSTNHAATKGNPEVLPCNGSNKTPSHQPASKDQVRDQRAQQGVSTPQEQHLRVPLQIKWKPREERLHGNALSSLHC